MYIYTYTESHCGIAAFIMFQGLLALARDETHSLSRIYVRFIICIIRSLLATLAAVAAVYFDRFALQMFRVNTPTMKLNDH